MCVARQQHHYFKNRAHFSSLTARLLSSFLFLFLSFFFFFAVYLFVTDLYRLPDFFFLFIIELLSFSLKIRRTLLKLLLLLFSDEHHRLFINGGGRLC